MELQSPDKLMPLIVLLKSEDIDRRKVRFISGQILSDELRNPAIDSVSPLLVQCLQNSFQFGG